MSKNSPVNSSELERERSELVNRLPWSAEIFLPTQKIDLMDQVLGLRRVVDIQENRLFQIYRPQLRALKDRYEGRQRCFIIGNGPSLNETDLSQLRNEVTFCVNGFFLKMPELDWTPTFYVVEDHLVAEDRAEEINTLKGPTKLFPAYLGYCLNEGADTIFFNHRARISYPHGFDFSTDASEHTFAGCTVTFTCMQLAHYLGFDEVYLIGVDASYQIPSDAEHSSDYGTGILDMASDDPNHFHPDYFGKGYRWHDPQVHKMLEAYAEARRVTDELGRPIFNATVGGELEVFERRRYRDVFPFSITPEKLRALSAFDEDAARKEKRALEKRAKIDRENSHLSEFPKIALIDLTPASGTTASGALKYDLFEDWPRERLLQVSNEDDPEIVLSGGAIGGLHSEVTMTSPHRAAQAIAAFNPDAVLYRPAPERLKLQNIFEEVSACCGASTIVWMMDDWPSKLEVKKDPTHSFWAANLDAAFESAALRLSICDAMSDAFEQRYGQPFEPIANGVRISDWRNICEASDDQITRIRYAGNITEEMTLHTLINVAQAVEDLSESYNLKFEIRTRPLWGDLFGARFKRFQRTEIFVDMLSAEDYRKWITQADVTVLAYNFDELSEAYIKYSLANKLPELLASGVPALAVGPPSVASLQYLEVHDLAMRVTAGGVEPIREAIDQLLSDPALQMEIGEKAQNFAFRNLNLEDKQQHFYALLRSAAAKRKPLRNDHSHGYFEVLTASSEPIAKMEASMKTAHGSTNKLRQRPPRLPKYRRMLNFYLGWRGAFALTGVALSALPPIWAAFNQSWKDALLLTGPVIAFSLLFAFFAYLFTVIEDHQGL